MKNITLVIVALVLIALVTESCKRPPISSGQKRYNHRRY